MGRGAVLAGRLAAESVGPNGSPADLLVRVDGSNVAETAIQTADSMVSVEGLVAVVGHANSAASLAASQIYNRAEVVQIAPHSTAALYSQAGPFSFRMVSSDDRQGSFLAERLARERTEARLAVLYVNDDYGRGLRSAFLDALADDRFQVVLQLPHAEEEIDSAGIARTVRALEAADPDLIVWLGRGSVLHRYLGSLRARLGSVSIWGSDAAGRPDPGIERSEEWNGIRYVDFAYPEDSPELQAFREVSRRELGRDPETVELLTHDAVAVVLEGIRSGARSGPELRRFLISLGRERPAYPGLSGPIHFEADGDLDRGYRLRTIAVEGGAS